MESSRSYRKSKVRWVAPTESDRNWNIINLHCSTQSKCVVESICRLTVLFVLSLPSFLIFNLFPDHLKNRNDYLNTQLIDELILNKEKFGGI